MTELQNFLVLMRYRITREWTAFLSEAMDRDTLLVVLLTVMALVLLRQLKSRFWLFFHLTFPSTLLHELTHYIVSLVTNGQPRGLNVSPEHVSGGVRLGYVMTGNLRWYNGTLIAIAPILLWVGASVMISEIDLNRDFPPWLVAKIYITACLIEGGIPSRSDLQLAIKFSLFPIAILVIAGIIMVVA